ncbi:transporter substrate-binding domain-containing protein [Chitinibacteraceae bacterium HSL-7]
MKKLLALAALIAVGGAAAWFVTTGKATKPAAPAAATAEAGQPAAPERVLRVALEGRYPPFEYLDSNQQLVGFNIDVANALCESMHVRCEFKRYDWDGLIPALERGDADAIIASMSVTEERKQRVLFTDIYTRVPGAFVAAKNAKFIWPVVTAERIQGKAIGVAADTTFDDYLKNGLESDGVKVIRYPSVEELFAALNAGEVELAFGDSAVFSDFMKTPENSMRFEFVANTVKNDPWLGDGEAIAIPKNKPELQVEMNEALQKLVASPTYQDLQNRYFLFRVL